MNENEIILDLRLQRQKLYELAQQNIKLHELGQQNPNDYDWGNWIIDIFKKIHLLNNPDGGELSNNDWIAILDDTIEIAAPSPSLYNFIIKKQGKGDLTDFDIAQAIIKRINYEFMQNILDNLNFLLISKRNILFEYSGIHTIRIDYYKNLQNIRLDISQKNNQFIVFTGFNGEGKTTILQAIAAALWGNSNDQLVQYNIHPYTEKEILASIMRENYPYVLEYDTKIIQPTCYDVLGYGTARLRTTTPQSEEEIKNRQSPIHGLFSNESLLLDIGNWLREQLKIYDNPSRVEEVKKVLCGLMPTVKEIRIEKEHKFFPRYVEHDKPNSLLSAEELSAGNKSILAMIGDMIIRLFEVQPEVEKVSDLEGIVLIDELETHLHPIWQREFSRILSETFPKVQFIVTTHSPITLLGMPPERTTLYNVTSENGKTVVNPLNIDLANMLPDEILTSALFGMDNIRSAYNKGIEYLSVETTQERAKREDEERKSAERSKNFKFNLPKTDD
jgi:predicted ATPase